VIDSAAEADSGLVRPRDLRSLPAAPKSELEPVVPGPKPAEPANPAPRAAPPWGSAFWLSTLNGR